MMLKKCLVCGTTLFTWSKKKYCSTRCAQQLYNKRWRENNPGKARAYQIRWWNRNNKGTFSERYLSIRNGRVYGALLLERDKQKRAQSRSHGGFVNPWIAHYSGDGDGRCEQCGSEEVIIIINHQAYCNECGGKIKLALENEYYSVVEPTCHSCGLVYPS